MNVYETGEACRTHESYQKSIKGLVGKPEDRRPLGRLKHGWKNNIQMAVREMWAGFSWLRIRPNDGHSNTVMKFRTF
jgi:hypothetical protein